jgi:hypothetical protein
VSRLGGRLDEEREERDVGVEEGTLRAASAVEDRGSGVCFGRGGSS